MTSPSACLLLRRVSFAVALSLFTPNFFAATVTDRKAAVLDDRARMENNQRWIYNDWKRGFEEAKRTGKPLLVVLRCVPCTSCMGIDASVLSEPDLQPVLDKFVRVRLMNANTLDLSLFQFDYDLSFSSMIFNGDGTIYGRYGSWTHQKDPYEKTTTGFKTALESALQIHKGYPANKESLRGKQGRPMPVKDPLELPQLAGKYKRELDWEGKVVQSCVHCHQVSDAVRSMYRDQKKTIPEQWVYPMPSPETIGLTLAADSVGRVEGIKDGSIAATAGLKAGDQIVELENQSLVSLADVAWALHHAPENGSITAKVRRGAEEKALKVSLPSNWRRNSDISRRAGTWEMRAMATGGMLLIDLPDAKRAERGLANDQLALFAEHVGEYGIHAAAKKAGFKKEDVLVEVDGISKRITESELIGHLLAKYQKGENIKARVLRGNEKFDLEFSMQ
jgi:serine protease Do